MGTPSIIVFDVNETLVDIESIGPFFERKFGDQKVLREWFQGSSDAVDGMVWNRGQDGAFPKREERFIVPRQSDHVGIPIENMNIDGDRKPQKALLSTQSLTSAPSLAPSQNFPHSLLWPGT